jgi:hypothetical protein
MWDTIDIFSWLAIPIAWGRIWAGGKAVEAFMRILDSDCPAQVLRYASLAILAIGFHFDLLSS